MGDKKKSQVPVTRRDPFQELGEFPTGWRPFESRLGRLLEEVWGEGRRAPGGFLPAMDVSEDEQRYLVTAELPGISKDDVTVELKDGVLTIQGEKKHEREEKKERQRWVERSYGSFVRSFTLPPDADANRIQASFKDGVLTLEIPRTEESKPKTISIRS